VASPLPGFQDILSFYLVPYVSPTQFSSCRAKVSLFARLLMLNLPCLVFKTLRLLRRRWRSQYSDSVRAGRSGDRIPVGARLSAPVQTGCEAHPAFYAIGTGSIPGLRRPGRGVDHPPQFSAEFKERVELYLYSPSGPSWPVLNFTFTFTFT